MGVGLEGARRRPPTPPRLAALFSTGAMVAAVTVSAAVGLFFGFYPAWKASRLDPIVALRAE